MGWCPFQPPWVPNPNFFVQVESQTLIEQPGDSGGPWFYNKSAYGIHTGGCGCYGSPDVWGVGIYGAIDFAETATHTKVLTVSP